MTQIAKNGYNNGGRCFAVWLLPILLLFLQQQQFDCRYLPTRSYAEGLDKLRELMVQILETSKEDPEQNHQLMRLSNEANINQRKPWINKLIPSEVLEEAAANYGSNGFYGTGRYY